MRVDDAGRTPGDDARVTDEEAGWARAARMEGTDAAVLRAEAASRLLAECRALRARGAGRSDGALIGCRLALFELRMVRPAGDEDAAGRMATRLVGEEARSEAVRWTPIPPTEDEGPMTALAEGRARFALEHLDGALAAARATGRRGHGIGALRTAALFGWDSFTGALDRLGRVTADEDAVGVAMVDGLAAWEPAGDEPRSMAASMTAAERAAYRRTMAWISGDKGWDGDPARAGRALRGAAMTLDVHGDRSAAAALTATARLMTEEPAEGIAHVVTEACMARPA